MSRKKAKPDETQAGAEDFALAVGAALKNGIAACCPARLTEPLVLVAFSGGPDSTALALALSQVAENFSFRIALCHVNHGIRGAEADADQKFCADFAARLGLTLHTRKVRAADTSEDALRQARYDALTDVAKKCAATFVVTGHTLDDQAETLLFRIFRGTSLRGFAGIQQCRKLSGGVTLLRPMLSLARQQCLDFLAANGIEARQDSSNLDERYARNYIRHVLLPRIFERFPGVVKRLINLSRMISADDELLSYMTEEKWVDLNRGNDVLLRGWDLDVLRAQPLALRRRLIARALDYMGVEVSFERVSQILELAGGSGLRLVDDSKPALSLNERFDVRVEDNSLVWIDKEQHQSNGVETNVDLKIPGLTIVPALSRALKVEMWEHDAAFNFCVFPPADSDEVIVDLSKAQLPLTLRNRRTGDVIQPFGMSEHVRLKKYLHTHKAARKTELENIPVGSEEQASASILVVADQKEVIWVPGVGLSEKVRVRGRPTHHISWVELANDLESLA